MIDKYTQLLNLHRSGMTSVEISKVLGVTPTQVCRRIRAMGLVANGRKAKKLERNGDLAKCCSCGKWKLLNKNFEKTKSGGYLSSCFSCRYSADVKNKNANEGLYLRTRYSKLKYNAIKRHIPFDISFSEIVEILQKQKYKCFYTDCTLELRYGPQGCNNNLSFDRVIPELGYVSGNVVLCTQRINAVKLNLTLHELKMWIPLFYEKIINSDFLRINEEEF